MAGVASTSSETSEALYASPKVEQVTTSGTADLETSFIFRTGVRRFDIVNRGNRVVLISYATGAATTKRSLYPGAPHRVEKIGTSPLTIFLQSSGTSQVLEVESWL